MQKLFMMIKFFYFLYILLFSMLAIADDKIDIPGSQEYYDGNYKTALELLLPQAKNGDDQAQLLLGYMYNSGYGVEEDIHRAVEFYKLSANSENDLAQFELGNVYQYGHEDLEIDYNLAVYWYELAFKNLNYNAAVSLGYLYSQGLGVKKNLIKSFQLYEIAAQAQNRIGLYNMARALSLGEGTNIDINKSIELYKKSAEKKYDLAQYNLGYMYYNGEQFGLKIDYKEATKWFLLCAYQSNAECENYLGLIYENGGYGIKADQNTAVKWFKKAARNDLPLGQYNYARKLQQGLGVEKNISEAFKWYNISGLPASYYNMAYELMEGKNIEADTNESERLYILAAEMGSQMALNNLGYLYEYGEYGFPINEKLAYYWYGILLDTMSGVHGPDFGSSYLIQDRLIEREDVNSWKQDLSLSLSNEEIVDIENKIAIFSIKDKNSDIEFVEVAAKDNYKNTNNSTILEKSEKRIALVIGIENYKIAPLKNPVNDALLMKDTLEDLNFEVLYYEDLDQRSFKEAIYDFEDKIKDLNSPNTNVLFYYSGHGIQHNGENYLIPINSKFDSPRDLEYETIPLGRVISTLEGTDGVKIVFLDACRNSPFRSYVRGANKGLSYFIAPKGSIISFSTSPGAVADDGNDVNSPYTLALADSIKKNNISIEQSLKLTSRIVLEKTDNVQQPWYSSSLSVDFYFTK
ncbi:MAG: hypothetical protein CMJ11_06250 [Pelagibacterales bacterium]|nr:hypothetical protein [Pelagibacterales bacterium]